MQPTALVHEAYLRLSKTDGADWEGRRRFFGAAANAMRQIIVEHARRRLALKRGGDRSRVEMHDPVFQLDASPEDLLTLDESLASFEDKHPRLSRVVVLRYFGGLSEEDSAQVLEVSPRTVRRDCLLAKAFLAQALEAATERANPH
ncbi:MAG: ECF-type sigma factor [Planctomycetota bacterium]